MQVQIIKAKTIPNYVNPYNGMIDCVKQVFKANGIAGAYQGSFFFSF